MNKKKIIIIGSIVIVLLLGFYLLKNKKVSYSLETIEVKKGDITKEITASGTLEALNTIDVGTQVSGIISKVLVDYNDHVKKGQIIAELDKITLQSNVLDAEAAMMRCDVQVEKTKKEWERDKILLEQKSISQVEYDVAWFDYQTAIGNKKSAEAQLNRAKTNLKYATIISPVDGVVLARKVDEGQTVAASFNTPTLFSIAQDLTKMRVLADIDEADIGQVRVEQNVSFTVDAYTNLQFTGTVKQIRLEPKTSQNVVTYTVVVEVQNKDFLLMPGMTTNLSIIINQKKNVLNVAQSALRFKPDNTFFNNKNYKFSMSKNLLKDNNENVQLKQGEKVIVWKLKNDSVIALPVVIGISDGNNFELEGALQQGDKLITEVKLNDAKAEQTAKKNPFMPQFPKKK